MKRLLFVSAALLLSACSDPKDANEKNFAAATETYLQKRGALCLSLRQRWPFEVQADGGIMRQTLDQLTALEAAGLVRSERFEQSKPMTIMGDGGTRTVAMLRYHITESGQQFAKPVEGVVVVLNAQDEQKPAQQFCYGHKRLDEVAKWEGPMALGEYQEARVFYTYKISDVAPWTDRDDVRRAFPELQRHLGDNAKREDRLTVKLTSEGWEPKRI